MKEKYFYLKCLIQGKSKGNKVERLKLFMHLKIRVGYFNMCSNNLGVSEKPALTELKIGKRAIYQPRLEIE